MKAKELEIGSEYIVSTIKGFYKIRIVDITETSIALVNVDKENDTQKIQRFGISQFDEWIHVQERVPSEAERFAKFVKVVNPSNYPDKTVQTDWPTTRDLTTTELEYLNNCTKSIGG